MGTVTSIYEDELSEDDQKWEWDESDDDLEEFTEPDENMSYKIDIQDKTGEWLKSIRLTDDLTEAREHATHFESLGYRVRILIHNVTTPLHRQKIKRGG